MPLAVTHVLSSLLAFDVYRDFLTKHKRYVTLHAVFLAGLGGLLPDIDILIGLVYQAAGRDIPSLLIHGGITHTPFFAVLFAIPAFYLYKIKKHKYSMMWFAVAFGIVLHVFLDYLLGGGNAYGVMWLFPFSLERFKVHLLVMTGISSIFVALDAVMLIAWLWYMDKQRKIRDYI